MSGSRLGGTLEILGPLGAGGMGEVYRARDSKLGREVAVKVLPAELADDPSRMARFEHEARTASALNHPNIVTLHDVGREGPTVYQVLELVQGQTVRDLLAKGAPPLRSALQIAEQIAAGLAAAHASSIVHRDLKPENVMVRDDGVVKILDFGLAKLHLSGAKGGTHLLTAPVATSPGVILGTAGYMSPEQARGEAVDFRSDQFSLGAILYEMITGARAFAGDSAAQTLAAIIEKEPAPVTSRRPEAPRPLLWILDRCLAKAPRDRYASTLDLARDLRSVREHLSEITSGGTVPALGSRPRLSHRTLALLWGVAGVVLGVALSAGVGGLAGIRWKGAGGGSYPDPPRLRTITFSGQDYLPAASTDGRVLAFVSMRDGTARIWLRSLQDGSEAPITAGPDLLPRISRDGSMVLFTRDEGERTSLYRVATLGGEPRKVADDAGDGDWSPHGDQVVFLRAGTREGKTITRLCVAALDGGGERELLADTENTLASPRWSPDGTWIAVAASQFGGSESTRKFIHLLHPDGSGATKLRPPEIGGDVTGAAWLAGSREIVYGQGESVSTVALGGGVINSGASRIWRQDVYTGKARVVLWAPALSTVTEIVAPGHLIFDAVTARQGLQEFELAAGADAKGVLLSQATSLDRQPVYSPDGEWVAFSSNRSGNLDVWARSRRSGELKRLTDHPDDDWDPAFTRDGKQLIWTSRRSGNFEIWMANVDGTNARQITQDGVDAENATSTPDGQWLVYNSGNPAKVGIWKVRTDGTQAERLVEGSYAWPEVSPDGQYFSFAMITGTGRTVLRVGRIDDGQPVPFEIAVAGAQAPNGRTRWLPDGSAIAFNWNDQAHVGIYAQDFRPGSDTAASRRRLVDLDRSGIAETFGISPDGKRIAVAASFRVFSLMSAENVADLQPPRGGS